MLSKKSQFLVIMMVLLLFAPNTMMADNGLDISAGADFTSRYVWRGLMINDAPNIQPAITLGWSGLEVGLWGSSTLSKTNEIEDNYAFSHEVDIWAGYTYEHSSGMTLGVVITDYYFPNAGAAFSNFNNHDNEEGAGAHTLEAGLLFGGSETFPIGLSAFMNTYNDAGTNMYFQLDYAASLNSYGIDLSIGAASGNTDNPDYYGTDGFNIINVGCTISKEVKITESFALPVFVNYIINPLNDVSYLVFGFSL